MLWKNSANDPSEILVTFAKLLENTNTDTDSNSSLQSNLLRGHVEKGGEVFLECKRK